MSKIQRSTKKEYKPSYSHLESTQLENLTGISNRKHTPSYGRPKEGLLHRLLELFFSFQLLYSFLIIITLCIILLGFFIAIFIL